MHKNKALFLFEVTRLTLEKRVLFDYTEKEDDE